MITVEQLNGLTFAEAVQGLLACCGSQRWAHLVAQQRPFADLEALRRAVDHGFAQLTEADWHAAFAAHPRIGDMDAASDGDWSRQEQRCMENADAAVRAALAQGNRDYFARFGFIFLICASGKSAAEMLAVLTARLQRTRPEELACATREQQKITHLRLDKWVQT